MKERFITFLGALLALYAVYVLLLPKPQPQLEPVSQPTTEDKGEAGLAVAYQWLRQNNIPTHSLRDRYSALSANSRLPEQGNLLIVSLPLRIDSRDWEAQQLVNWIDQGNNLVLLANLNDAEAGFAYQQHVNAVTRRFGYEFDEIEIEKTDNGHAGSEAGKQEDEPDKHYLQPVPHLDLTRGIAQVAVTNPQQDKRYWQLGTSGQLRSVLPLLQDPASDSPALWLARSGNGQVFLSRYARLFSNQYINQQDNARLLLNLLQHSLGPKGHVIFDDMHQGLSQLYDAEAFFADDRLHNTLWFILALWLIYVLGHTNRLQPVREKRTAMRLIDNIKGIGNFLARRLHRAAVARRLFYHFFNELRRYRGMPRNGEPLWNELSQYQQLSTQELSQLKTLYQQALQQQSVNLVRLGQLINRIRKKLS